MIVATFKGHKLSNGAAAIALYYPIVSKGGDLINDIAATVDNPAKTYPTMLLCYAAFRMAGDQEARNKTVDELLSEVNLFDTEEATEFIKVIQSLLNEKSKKD